MIWAIMPSKTYGAKIMTTLKTKAAAAVAAKADKAPQKRSQVSVDFAVEASNLAEAKIQADARIGEARQSELARVAEIAGRCKGITREQFDEHFKPVISAAFSKRYQESAIGPMLTYLRTSFLSLANGGKVPKGCGSTKAFYDAVAKEHVRTLEGKAPDTKTSGRPKGTTSHNAKAEPIAQVAKAFGGDKVARKWRARALEAILKADPEGKLLDSHLSDILDSLDIEID